MAKKTKKTEETTAIPTPTPVPIETPTAQVATPAAPEVKAAKTKPTETRVKGDNVKAAKSSVASPVRVVHQFVAEMVKANPEVRRRDLVEACCKAGVAFHTSRTQVNLALKKARSVPSKQAQPTA
jgi:hypothetical protein